MPALISGRIPLCYRKHTLGWCWVRKRDSKVLASPVFDSASRTFILPDQPQSVFARSAVLDASRAGWPLFCIASQLTRKAALEWILILTRTTESSLFAGNTAISRMLHAPTRGFRTHRARRCRSHRISILALPAMIHMRSSVLSSPYAIFFRVVRWRLEPSLRSPKVDIW
jgi:hypothetical protein